MPKAGDTFITQLKRAHLEWGTHRYTNTREKIYGEGYLQIPAHIARKFFITNSNRGADATYICSSADGYLDNVALLAAGSSKRGHIFAKQFQGRGALKLLGRWFDHIGAEEGDLIEVRFISTRRIQIKKL